MKTFTFLCDIQVRGRDWGVTAAAGKVVGLNEDIGDGKTIADLIDGRCILPGHYRELDEPALDNGFDDEGEK